MEHEKKAGNQFRGGKRKTETRRGGWGPFRQLSTKALLTFRA
jgi:hypothetical protein